MPPSPAAPQTDHARLSRTNPCRKTFTHTITIKAMGIIASASVNSHVESNGFSHHSTPFDRSTRLSLGHCSHTQPRSTHWGQVFTNHPSFLGMDLLVTTLRGLFNSHSGFLSASKETDRRVFMRCVKANKSRPCLDMFTLRSYQGHWMTLYESIGIYSEFLLLKSQPPTPSPDLLMISRVPHPLLS